MSHKCTWGPLEGVRLLGSEGTPDFSLMDWPVLDMRDSILFLQLYKTDVDYEGMSVAYEGEVGVPFSQLIADVIDAHDCETIEAIKLALQRAISDLDKAILLAQKN